MMKTAIKKLNILILNYEYPPVGGGAGTISHFHASHLAMRNHTVTLLTVSENNQLQIINKSKYFKIIKLPSKRKHLYQSGIFEKISWMQHAKKYLCTVDDTKYDICMAHFSIPGGWVAKQLKKKNNTPYVIISHGQDIPWFYPKQMFFYHILTAYAIKNILKHSERLFVQSEMMYNNAIGFIKKDFRKVALIPNGCDDTLFKISPLKYRNRSLLKLLFVGRLTKQKRPEMLIHICHYLRTQHIKYHLKICGNGPMKKKLDALVKKYKLTDQISFTGWVTNEKVRAMYDDSHILLAPSEAEGMSITVLEALFSGLYVITTAVSGNPDLLKDSNLGCIVENNKYAFTDAIKRYIKNNYTAQQIEEWRNKLVEDYSWENIIAQYEKNLYDILENYSTKYP